MVQDEYFIFLHFFYFAIGHKKDEEVARCYLYSPLSFHEIDNSILYCDFKNVVFMDIELSHQNIFTLPRSLKFICQNTFLEEICIARNPFLGNMTMGALSLSYPYQFSEGLWKYNMNGCPITPYWNSSNGLRNIQTILQGIPCTTIHCTIKSAFVWHKIHPWNKES